MVIYKVTDPEFAPYGKVLEGYDLKDMLAKMEETPLPEDSTVYVPSDKNLEALAVAEEFRNRAYGGLPIQIGYCNGNNHKLNALEYHRCSEVNVAATDMILLLGRQQDIEKDYTYDTSKVEAFLVPAGTAIEVYGTSLHYAPCNAKEGGFRCVVVLPEGTNTEIDFKISAEGEDKLMTAKNKWLIAHPEAGIEGAVAGLKGENLTV